MQVMPDDIYMERERGGSEVADSYNDVEEETNLQGIMRRL